MAAPTELCLQVRCTRLAAVSWRRKLMSWAILGYRHCKGIVAQGYQAGHYFQEDCLKARHSSSILFLQHDTEPYSGYLGTSTVWRLGKIASLWGRCFRVPEVGAIRV